MACGLYKLCGTTTIKGFQIGHRSCQGGIYRALCASAHI